MPTELSYNDKVFQMLIDLNDGETFDIENKVRSENREKFYEIVQYFRESEFCKDFDIFIMKTQLRKQKKGKWINIKNLRINKEKPISDSSASKQNNILQSKQRTLDIMFPM